MDTNPSLFVIALRDGTLHEFTEPEAAIDF
jgi:hypothetical protein